MSELTFTALGGLGEIGMNMALYGFKSVKKRQFLMVDCGVSFAGDDLPGVDLVFPSIEFIEAERKNLLGIIITHAHEDHFGALAELGPRLQAPIYMTPFAANLLEARRLNEPGAPKLNVRIIPQVGRFTIGPFDVETIPVAHSIPESMALAIRTEAGTVLHTGDWKIDETPIVGLPTDGNRLKEIGDEGVMALICDSTNVTREGISPSETEVRESLRQIILGAKGRVAVTTFASNVARIRAVAEAAEEAGREVIIVGRAMDRVADVADELGMLDGLPGLKTFERFRSLARDKCVLLLTGSQGEQRAALARVAEGEHPEISLSKGDTVIFSSRTIPGNEKSVGKIVNNLAKAGIEIITDRDALVHVSGHPRKDELRRMYEWVRPKIAVPAHGEALHLSLHRDFAAKMGVKSIVTAYNGDVIALSPEGGVKTGAVSVGRTVKDGDIMIAADSQTMKERRRLSYVGTVVASVTIDERGALATDPEIFVYGLPEKDEEGASMVGLVRELVDEVFSSLPRTKRRDASSLQQALERGIKAGISEIWGKKPVTAVLVHEV